MDYALLSALNGLVGRSTGAFECTLALCGQLPLALCVAAMLAWWWTDPGGARALEWPGGSTPGVEVHGDRIAVHVPARDGAHIVVERVDALGRGGERP